MKKIYNPKRALWEEILERPSEAKENLDQLIENIFAEVKADGDKAIFKFTEEFDGISLEDLLVSEEEIDFAITQVSEELKNAINLAKSNIECFHTAQITKKVFVTTQPGVECWMEKRPIQKIGLYIPGGTAPLFSTVLMLAIPARIAGCKEIVLCTPPQKSGKIDPAILYTANLCGVSKIYKVGGAQAIAGMTFGTESIPKVYKIFGPGNQFVTAAKQMATRFGVAIDMPAGPSELMVVADDSANAAFVASDLLSQAEHGKDSQVLLLSPSENFITAVEKELEKQLFQLPRKEIAGASTLNSKMILLKNEGEILEMINEYAPEHLIIAAENEEIYIKGVVNAGSVFIGNYSPESAGDYASGTNHTLPTNGFAKQYSGVNLDSFLKSVSFQKITKEGIANIGPAIEIMAEAEGLQAHKNAVTLRLKDIK